MNTDPLHEWRDILLRRDLGPEEYRAVSRVLADHPEAAAQWAEDIALARALRNLPDVPVATNFTSRVLAEIGRESATPEPSRIPVWQRIAARWRPALGLAAVASVTLLAAWQVAALRQQENLAREMSALQEFKKLSPDVLEDFEAIRRYDAGSPPVDYGLLAALQ